jgi:hypothetical protein
MKIYTSTTVIVDHDKGARIGNAGSKVVQYLGGVERTLYSCSDYARCATFRPINDTRIELILKVSSHPFPTEQDY